MLDIRYKSILTVALPMMLSGFIQSVISITDAAFLSRFSKLAYDASGSAGLWYITMYMVFIGLGDGAQIAMAQKVGEKNERGFAAVFQSNFVILFIAAIVLTLLVQLGMPALMNYLVTNNELAQAEQSFLEIRSYSFWAATITISIQASYLAVGKTTLVLITSLIAALSNIVLDYFLVFGIGPFPRLGLEGAAIASTTAEFLAMLFLLGTLIGGKLKKQYPVWKENFISKFQLKENLRIGIPLLFQGIVALSIWTIFFIWIEQMGGDNLTVSLNIRYIYFLAFIPIWGFAAATKTYIAQYFGAKEFHQIPVIQRRIQFLTVCFLFLTFHGSLFYPETLIRLVSDQPEHVAKSAQILRIVSGSIFIYGLGSVYFQTISGIGKTRTTFLVECLATTLYILSAYLFIKVWSWPVQWVWLVEYVYFITMGFTSFLYLKWINRTQKEIAYE
jgi:multidrug resistance protein, MATE family